MKFDFPSLAIWRNRTRCSEPMAVETAGKALLALAQSSERCANFAVSVHHARAYFVARALLQSRLALAAATNEAARRGKIVVFAGGGARYGYPKLLADGKSKAAAVRSARRWLWRSSRLDPGRREDRCAQEQTKQRCRRLSGPPAGSTLRLKPIILRRWLVLPASHGGSLILTLPAKRSQISVFRLPTGDHSWGSQSKPKTRRHSSPAREGLRTSVLAICAKWPWLLAEHPQETRQTMESRSVSSGGNRRISLSKLPTSGHSRLRQLPMKRS